MTAQDIIEVLREAIFVLLIVGAPPMLVALIVGLMISLLQALTQIQEMTLTFVPKMVAMLLTLVVMLPFMMERLADFAHKLDERIGHVGESRE